MRSRALHQTLDGWEEVPDFDTRGLVPSFWPRTGDVIVNQTGSYQVVRWEYACDQRGDVREIQILTEKQS